MEQVEPHFERTRLTRIKETNLVRIAELQKWNKEITMWIDKIDNKT